MFSFKSYKCITPRGIRIPVASVKGRCPRPLDDGGLFKFRMINFVFAHYINNFTLKV